MEWKTANTRHAFYLGNGVCEKNDNKNNTDDDDDNLNIILFFLLN